MRNPLIEGTIKKIFEEKRYGFIESQEHPDGIFFLESSLKNDVNEGDLIVYEAHSSRKNPEKFEAKYIRKIYVSKNGIKIMEGINSRITQQTRHVLTELIPTIEIDQSKPIFHLQVKLENFSGNQYCIEVDENDKIIYAKRWKKNAYYKFVIDKKPVQTNEFTVILKQIEDFHMILAAFFGPKTEPFPWDKNADPEKSIAFWEKHAIVLSGEFDIKPETITGYLPEELEAYFKKEDE